MVKNHLISNVLLLVLLNAGVDAIKPTNPHSVKLIPQRESAAQFSGGTPIEADGNCFYRSLSYYMYGNQDHHRFIRQAVVNFMLGREDRYARLIDRFEDYARYISYHRQDDVWAEDAIVQAAADYFGINIYVTHYGRHGERSQPLQVTRATTEQQPPSGQNSQRWLHLQLQQSHYEIINNYSEEGVSEPSCKFDLLSIQDPEEIETSSECVSDILEKNKTGVPESGGSKIIPEDELPEIKDAPMEEDTTYKVSGGSKVIPEDELPEIKDPPMEEDTAYKISGGSKIIPEDELPEIKDPPMEEDTAYKISDGSKVIPDDELPEIKDPEMEEDTAYKMSDGSKIITEGEGAEIKYHPMEEKNIDISHSKTLISHEEVLERREPPSEDTVDNICRGMKVFKITEEEKDFEDQQQKKRIKNSVYQLELKLTENRLVESERDLTSDSRSVENLGTLENLFIDLEGEETEPSETRSDVPFNEVLHSDSEESIENQTEVPLGKKSYDSQKIDNMDHLRELIQNRLVGFGSHFRVRRRLGFYEYFHHFLTLETNNQSMTVLHLTITVPFNIFCEKAVVDFSNFNNTFFDFECGVELISWYAFPKNKTTLDEINQRIEEVIALGYINYSLTSSNKMYCASLVSYILTGEKDYKEVHEFVRRYGVFGIFLVLLVNSFCSVISNMRCLRNSVSKLKQKFTYMFKLVKSRMLDKFYSFFSCLCCILDLAANYLERSIEKTFKERKRSNKKDR